MVFSLKRIFVIFFSFFILIFFSEIFSASYSIGEPNSSIELVYGPSDSIIGWVNMSFNQELANTNFTASVNGVEKSITLLELLKKSNSQYSCIPLDCNESYSLKENSQPEQTKIFNLNENEEKIVGLNLTGNIISISSISFNVQSNAPPSCQNQLKIDFLNDNTFEFINNKSSGQSCLSKNYSCYLQSPSEENLELGSIPFCQKFLLTEAPAYSVGAWIKNNSGNKEIRLSLYNKNNYEVGNCKIQQQIPTSGGEVSCDINYTVKKPEEYTLCIYSVSGTGSFNIKGYSAQGNSSCGYYGSPPGSGFNAAYSLFVQPKGFDSPGNLQIPNLLSTGESLSSLAQDYINEKYGSLNCGTAGCIIPIRIYSGAQQQLNLTGLSLVYQKDIGTASDYKFYDIEKAPQRIFSGFQKIYLSSANFTLPKEFGAYSFSLKYNNSLIFTKKINVTDVPRVLSINTLRAPASYPTEFVITISSSRNISRIFWDFGDGSTETTTINKTTHTYQNIGIYNLTINITDIRGLSSVKKFEINVTSPKDVIEPRIEKIRENLNSIDKNIKSFDAFSQEAIKENLNLEEINSTINSLEEQFNNASSDEDYISIITELLKVNVPKNVFLFSKVPATQIVPEKDNIDLSLIKTITNENITIEDEEAYKDNILRWYFDNFEIKATQSKYFSEYEDYSSPLINSFTIDIAENTSEDYYIIIPKLDNLYIEKGTSFSEEGNYIYIKSKDIKNNRFSFSTTEDISVLDVPIIVSPKLTSLNIIEEVKQPEKTPKNLILIFVIIFLVIVFVAVYLFLRAWYNKKYEDYLFKNKNDLYNIAAYITTAKRRGISDKEIIENLKKSGWNSEQIRYAMRKYAGKKTGMPI